ncbi:MAG: hypothetical protein KAU29_10160 [Gammaproteobacteria bacterium]|nr:hypothetical protein [Gammaproteobacteria bacterium]
MAITAIIFSLCLAYVLVKIFTIDFEDEEGRDDTELLHSEGEARTGVPL